MLCMMNWIFSVRNTFPGVTCSEIRFKISSPIYSALATIIFYRRMWFCWIKGNWNYQLWQGVGHWNMVVKEDFNQLNSLKWNEQWYNSSTPREDKFLPNLWVKHSNRDKFFWYLKWHIGLSFIVLVFLAFLGSVKWIDQS